MGDWDEDPMPKPCPWEGCPHAYAVPQVMRLHLDRRHPCTTNGPDAAFCECPTCTFDGGAA